MNYDQETNSYNLIAQDNDKDMIRVEIGDSKQSDFYPQVKIMRWDNEVNFSVRLFDITATHTVIGEVISCDNAKFYPVDNGFEFEVILKEKPATNILEFTLSDKDVEYLYQPELTKEETNRGCKRPENVVGSYAVYAKTPKINYKGGKEYKCGKVGHIYRPKVYDAKKNEVWGELHIEDGLMTITIPQEFLDKAIYPVVVDPTFGYENVGLSKDENFTSYAKAGYYTSLIDCHAVSVSFAISTDGTPSTTDLRVGIFSYISSSNAGALLAQSNAEEVNITKEGTFNTLLLTDSYRLSGDTNYFLAGVHEPYDEDYCHYDSGNSTIIESLHILADFSNPFNESGSDANRKLSVYCTYSLITGPFPTHLRT